MTGKVGKIKRDIGEGGEKMGFEEFKLIETCNFKLEERLMIDLREEQRSKRRELLRENKQDAYWKLLETQAKEENDLLKKISKAVTNHYNISASIYENWLETYLDQAENLERLNAFRAELRNKSQIQREALPESFDKAACLCYAKKFHAKITQPKADLLM